MNGTKGNPKGGSSISPNTITSGALAPGNSFQFDTSSTQAYSDGDLYLDATTPLSLASSDKSITVGTTSQDEAFSVYWSGNNPAAPNSYPVDATETINANTGTWTLSAGFPSGVTASDTISSTQISINDGTISPQAGIYSYTYEVGQHSISSTGTFQTGTFEYQCQWTFPDTYIDQIDQLNLNF